MNREHRSKVICLVNIKNNSFSSFVCHRMLWFSTPSTKIPLLMIPTVLCLVTKELNCKKPLTENFLNSSLDIKQGEFLTQPSSG